MIRAILLSMMCLLLAGCASEPEKEYKPPRLMIAQNGDGDVTLQWESEPGYVYTIFYQSSSDADWQGLKNAFRVPGTGQALTVYDHVNPNRPPRSYRILAEEIK